jgi:hypothetical protein
VSLLNTARQARAPFSLERVQLDLDGSSYVEMKDPCPVYDGTRWHMFGTGVTGPHQFNVFHATADRLTGPWTLQEPVDVSTLTGGCVAAPGVIAEGQRLHMFLQTEYNAFDGRIEHLVSDDGGKTFAHARTAMTSLPGTDEAGIYDPDPAEIDGQKYLVYSAFSVIGSPDVHLARSISGSWDGPWERLGAALRHEEVWCHNQRGIEAYEWGLEGAQLVELPDGRVLLNAVCFLPGATAGTRQRVFFAVARDVLGPYEIAGPVLVPDGGHAAGENGHASLVVNGSDLALMFQERTLDNPHWRLGLAVAPIEQSLENCA